MTIEQRVAVLEEIFSKLQDYYTSAYSGEEIDARLASAGVPIGITKEYKSVAEMNQDFTGTDVQRGQFVLILPDSTASADYGKVYLKGTANWVYAFTLTTLTSIKGPIGPPGKNGVKGDPGEAGSSFAILGYFDTLDALKAAVPNPKAGDVYGVGTAPPYNIYIWDSVHGKWVANGNLQGPEGKQGIQGPDGKQGPEGKQGPPGPVGGSSNFVRYDAAQSLTDEQKAQARTNIGADTVQGAVLYTPQSLTDAQKTQARGNIGAIDSASLNRIGAVIGLCGWNQIIPTKTYVNSVTDTKTYLDFVIQALSGDTYIGALFNRYQSTPGKIVDIFTSKYDCNRISWKHSGAKTDISLVANTYSIPAQIKTGDKLLVSLDVLSVNTTVAGGLSTDNQMLINLTELFGAGNEPSSVDEFRAIFGTTYYPYYDYPTAITKNGIVEYLNPPMELGVEYRTTERYLGKPVYCQIVDFGYGPNNSHSSVSKAIENIGYIVRWNGTSSDGTAFPFENHMASPPPVLNGIVYKNGNTLCIVLYTNENKSTTRLYVCVYYTKTTD